MSKIIITTFDWVPEIPRGYVRDIRLRWALEEANISYKVETTSFKNRNKNHQENQPFKQVPWLNHGEISLFESGAMLLYIAEQSSQLMPKDKIGRNKVIEWLFAALNSVEMASLPWSIFKFSNDDVESNGRNHLDLFLQNRLTDMEKVLKNREWLTDTFSIADIAMVDVLRLVNRFGGLKDYPNLFEYVKRGVARPAFSKAHTEQLALYKQTDLINP